ncbi:hypothetical protein [Acidovorax sp. BLS4]|uniref:hypothetical protein n=1 Tax=Acidovorax sp. BLS4 TaxID=3273430 RepID=UPI002942E8B1|nr:hypothetical protein [Paracidovorax avenae]WOI44903.1 hypothetical protein R1Z03_20635 [Paracidovorax avenae]
MNFVESRLLGVQIDDAGREISLSIVGSDGAKFFLELHGIERFLINELRQQNIIENMKHWTQGTEDSSLRDAAYFLMTGVAENDCEPRLATIAHAVVERVLRGELEMVEITAVFGAQILASFTSMTLRAET